MENIMCNQTDNGDTEWSWQTFDNGFSTLLTWVIKKLKQ